MADAVGMRATHARPRHPALLVLLCLSAALTACGGGGGGADATAAAGAAPTGTAPSPSPSPSPTPTPPPTAPAPGTRATCNLPDFEATVMAAVNAWRARGATCGTQAHPAVASLAWNAALTQAALVHSEDMVAGNFFSHTGSDGSNAGQRASAAGYTWRTWGENIAVGQVGVDAVVAAWMDSPGHCANVMNARFEDIGLACVAGSSGNTYRTYWTMVLGAAR
jgi:uncharacterized protein YkwD